jgi:hypothetical protein
MLDGPPVDILVCVPLVERQVERGIVAERVPDVILDVGRREGLVGGESLEVRADEEVALVSLHKRH